MRGDSCDYYTQIQTSLPAASISEIVFSRIYNSLIRRKQDPEASVFLLGFDTMSLSTEKSLFDISLWIKTLPSLEDYVRNTTTEELKKNLERGIAPEMLSGPLWMEWQRHFQHHQEAFGRTAYEFDFANPTPAEILTPWLEAIKGFLAGNAQNPYARQQEMLEKREHATQAVLVRIGWPRKGWFIKLLRWAQDTGPMREDSIFDMGMGHPLIRRLLNELGRRFMVNSAIKVADDIYWLEKLEAENLVSGLENETPLPDLSERVLNRKAQWQVYLKITPPVILPEKSGWSKLLQGGKAERKNGKLVLKGAGTSRGTVTAPARVLFRPEDFSRFKPGDVLVAVTTTPAWTPLFAMAAAVVTDIGGPLSHSSIIAREYGIPAVMAAGTATRVIQDGQMVTVDGTKGWVTLE